MSKKSDSIEDEILTLKVLGVFAGALFRKGMRDGAKAALEEKKKKHEENIKKLKEELNK